MTSSFTIEDRIIAALRRIIRAVDLYSRRLVEAYGLTGPQLATLQEAARLDGVSASVLAKAVHISHSTLTGIIDRLERRGMVARVRKGEDRRSVTIRVTEDGAAVLATAPSLLQDRFRNELGKLEEWEQTMMLGMLQRIATMMDAEGIDAAPVLVTGSMGATSQEVVADADASGGATVSAERPGLTESQNVLLSNMGS